MAELRRERRNDSQGRGPRCGLPSAALVTLFAALFAGAAGHLLPGVAAWAAIGAAVLAGAYAAAQAARGFAGADGPKTHRLLGLLDRGGSAESRAPQGFTGEWATLYERVNRMALESQTNSAALAELERFRRQAELAASVLRCGKDPLTEIAELRVGPLRDLLEAAKDGATVGPVVSRLPFGEEDLIGADGDRLPETWPKGAVEPLRLASRDHADLGAGLDELLHGLTQLSASLSRRASTAASAPDGDTAHRTPAQLVDAVVHTAADGIEDLAAGLMRANELASVAERVTNRATLLALNAALEATRSGSEAFAAIAEETRRLAEFAREATDTISRLASEIEYKVGETITAIHATSEDAKTCLAELSGAPFTAPEAPRRARAQVEGLLERARGLKRAWSAPDRAPAGFDSPGEPTHADSPDAAVPAENPTVEAVGFSPGDPDPTQSLVENDRFSADKLPTEGIMLIEGLQPGARLES